MNQSDENLKAVQIPVWSLAHLPYNIITSCADFQTNLMSIAQTASFLRNRAVVKNGIAVQIFFFWNSNSKILVQSKSTSYSNSMVSCTETTPKSAFSTISSMGNPNIDRYSYLDGFLKKYFFIFFSKNYTYTTIQVIGNLVVVGKP